MHDIVVVGAGVAGASFAFKIAKHAKTLLIEAQDFKSNIPERTNIFAEHNRPFINEINWIDKEIFPLTHLKSNYMSEKENGIINSKEFGIPLGNICYTEKFLNFLIQGFEDQGGQVKFNEKVVKVNKHDDHLEIINNKGESYSTRLLILATGSRGQDLQRSLRFKIPDSYVGICTHLHGDEDKIRENFSTQYIFHINPKISIDGPFFMNVGIERVFVGFLGRKNETSTELVSKLDRILKNYKKIQPFVQGLKRGPDTIVGEISKHPIKSLSRDRILILGEAAGLVTAFFYEGILCGLASADIAVKTIIPLLEQNTGFNQSVLRKYDQEVYRVLLNKYFRNGDQCEYLFFNSGSSYIKKLWDTYCKLLNENQVCRKYIYDAYINQDLANHDLKKDRYVGEKLFGALPALTKLALGPRFIKTLLK